MSDRLRKLGVALLAIGLFTGTFVAPAAAVTDDGLLSDDGIEVGGDDGVSVGVDDGVSVGVGGDEGVSVGVGTEDGVNASVAGDEGVAVGAGPDDGLETSVAGREVTKGAPTDVTSQVSAIGGDSAPDVLGSSPVSDAEGPPDLGPSGLPGADGALPSTGSGQGLNLTETTGVEVCDLTRLDANKLPTGSLPGLDMLPSELAPPGVPTNLLTTETIIGLATGGVPGTCDVVDLNDPQLDPTDPPTEPYYVGKVIRSEANSEHTAFYAVYRATLNESGDGPSVKAVPSFVLGEDTANSEPEFLFNVGEGDYGIEPTIARDEDSVRLRGVVLVVGKNAGGELACTDLTEYDGDLSEESLADLGPCEYELVGIPSLVTPEDLLEILDSAGDGGVPVDPGGQLPIDDLLGL